MIDEEVEVKSRLRSFRLGNGLKGQERRSVRAVVPAFEGDIRASWVAGAAPVPEEALPERSQLRGVGTVDRDSNLAQDHGSPGLLVG